MRSSSAACTTDPKVFATAESCDLADQPAQIPSINTTMFARTSLLRLLRRIFGSNVQSVMEKHPLISRTSQLKRLKNRILPELWICTRPVCVVWESTFHEIGSGTRLLPGSSHPTNNYFNYTLSVPALWKTVTLGVPLLPINEAPSKFQIMCLVIRLVSRTLSKLALVTSWPNGYLRVKHLVSILYSWKL